MRRPARLASAAALLVGTALGCNLVLGIEEQPLRAPDAAPDVEVASTPDAAPRDERCTKDSDCAAPNGCYTPHCDTVLGACTYALCEAKGRACAAGACNAATGTCEAERDYGFRTTTYRAPGLTSGCGPDPDACVAAVFPFLFVGGRDDVAVLRVDDLLATSASRVAVKGLGFRPAAVVASGRRVWVVGEVQGTVPPYKLQLATIDVPSDPTVTELSARSALFDYPYPRASVFAAPSGGLLVAFDDVAEGLPSAAIAAPLPDAGAIAVVNPADAGPPSPPPTHPMVRVNAPGGAKLVGASGGRLIAYRFPDTVNLVTGAGAPGAALGPDQALAPGLPALLPPRFAQGADGALAAVTPVVADPPGDCNCRSNQRIQWVMASAASPSVEANQLADYETYQNPHASIVSPCHSCNPPGYFTRPALSAWVDRRTMLVAAPASDPAENRTLTAVRGVERDPIAVPPKRRFRTAATDTPRGDFATDRIALAASAGLGYLVLADAQGNDVVVSIFDPRCEAR